jgi:predicted nucleic acid-binding protein
MTLVDTSVWIDFLHGTENGHTVLLTQLLRTHRIGLTDLILTEVLQGIRDEKTFKSAQQEFADYELFDSAGRTLAIQSARNYRLLRTKGITVRSTIDCLTATLCLLEDHTLFHRDRDYDAFEKHLSLKVLHPALH